MGASISRSLLESQGTACESGQKECGAGGCGEELQTAPPDMPWLLHCELIAAVVAGSRSC